MLHPLASLWRHPARVWFYASDAMAGRAFFQAGAQAQPQALGTRRRFCSADEAFDYLRYWSGTPDARAELKSLLQRSGTSLVGAHAGGDGWLRGLAARLSSGAVVVVEEPQAAGRPGRLVAAASAAAGGDEVASLPLLSDMVASPTVAAPEPAAPAPASGASAVSPERETDQEPDREPDQEAEPEPEGPASAADQVTQAETPEQAVPEATPFREIGNVAQTADTAAPEPAEVDPAADQPDQLDQVAQAETLEQAARDGTPFCEICNAAQAADTAAPEPAEVETAADQPDQLDQVAQAETLEQAARDGTPFCEICVASATAAQA